MKSPNLPEGETCFAAASAADLRLLHLGGNELLAALCPEPVLTVLTGAGFRFLKEDIVLGARYPEDCRLNAAIFGGKIIYNPNTIDSAVADTWLFLCGEIVHI